MAKNSSLIDIVFNLIGTVRRRLPLKHIAIVGVFVVAILVLSVPEFQFLGINRGKGDTPLGLSLGLDLQGGSHLVYRIVPTNSDTITKEDAESLAATINARVNEFGVSESIVQLIGGGENTAPDRLLVQIPAKSVQPYLDIRFENQPYDSYNPNRHQSIFDLASIQDENAASDAFNVVTQDLLLIEEEIETIIRDELNYTDVSRLDNFGSPFESAQETTTFTSQYVKYTYQFENLNAEYKDKQGMIITPSDAELIYRKLQERFKTVIDFAFVTPEVTAQTQTTVAIDTIPLPETIQPPPDINALLQLTQPNRIPTYDEVVGAFTIAGYSNAVITIVDSELAMYQAVLGDVTESGIDQNGNSVPDGFVNISSELSKIGTIQRFFTRGDFSYTTGGGIEETKRLIGSTAQLEFRERSCAPLTPRPSTLPQNVSDQEWEFIRCQDPIYYIEQNTGLSGNDLVDAYYGFTEDSGHVVNIAFDQDGTKTFFDVTSRISTGEGRLAIYLDGRELVAPGASRPIPDGRAFIYGNFTQEEARSISIQLRAGALPASLELIQEREVDATLGADSLQKSIIAGSVGLALLVFFLISYYKVQGVISSVTLVFYAVILIATFKIIPVTVTLSGAAAIILSFGFAVDANILIAERIKEELRTGKSIFNAIPAGFDRAWSSIRDGNLSTFIIALVLYWFGDRFGTSIIQGFALTLGIGVLLSMITAFLVNRVIMRTFIRIPALRRSELFLPVVVSEESNQSSTQYNSPSSSKGSK